MGLGPIWYQSVKKTCYTPNILCRKNDIYVNKFENVILASKYVFYRQEHIAKGGPMELNLSS